MVTVREQLPGRLTELSDEATVEHAEEAQLDLVSWLDRVRDILGGAELKQLEEVAQLTLEKSWKPTSITDPTPLYRCGNGRYSGASACR